MPAVYDLYYMQSLWENAPSEALAVRDNVYATFLTLPLFMIGAVFLWSYMSTTRRESGYQSLDRVQRNTIVISTIGGLMVLIPIGLNAVGVQV